MVMTGLDNKGVALLLTFIFMISLSVVAGAYIFMVTFSARGVSGANNNVKALYLAEAGLNKAVYYLTNTAPDDSTDASWRTTAYPADPGEDPTDPQQEALGDGTYTMWVETSGSDIQVTARGTVAGIERIIRETVTISTAVPEAFDYAQFSGGDIDFDDSTGTVTGDIAAVGSVDNESGMTITGSTTESSAVVSPTVDLDAYAAIATTTYGSNHTYSSGTYSGIHYVDGRATINDNVTFNGTLVATGNIVFTNTDDFDSTPTDNYPALVSGATITGNRMKTATIRGLVYAATSINIPRGDDNTIEGSIISGGDIDLDNEDDPEWTITYDSDLASDPPPYFTEGAGGATGDDWVEL